MFPPCRHSYSDCVARCVQSRQEGAGQQVQNSHQRRRLLGWLSIHGPHCFYHASREYLVEYAGGRRRLLWLSVAVLPQDVQYERLRCHSRHVDHDRRHRQESDQGDDAVPASWRHRIHAALCGQPGPGELVAVPLRRNPLPSDAATPASYAPFGDFKPCSSHLPRTIGPSILCRTRPRTSGSCRSMPAAT